MSKTQKLSVTVEARVLEEIRRLAPEMTISFLVDDALKNKLTRLRLRALLDEMERESPMSEEGRRAGDELWERIESFWTPEPSARSLVKRKKSVASSSARSKRKPTS